MQHWKTHHLIFLWGNEYHLVSDTMHGSMENGEEEEISKRVKSLCIIYKMEISIRMFVSLSLILCHFWIQTKMNAIF